MKREYKAHKIFECNRCEMQIILASALLVAMEIREPLGNTQRSVDLCWEAATLMADKY